MNQTASQKARKIGSGAYVEGEAAQRHVNITTKEALLR